ncbi:hypothetical protein ABKA04_005120 [Annulohypoxylon sp. FPYF3050]
MASSQGERYSQQHLYCWDPILDSRQKLSDDYDEPFVEAFSAGDLDSDFITSFMQAFDENDACNYATKRVVDFCKGADLAGLRQNMSATTELVALLDDGIGSTALNLYETLVKMKEDSKRKGPDATRRYIPSLTPWTVVALAASAPTYQASILGEFMFNHLRFDPLINAYIQRDNITSFTFEFQLPYFSLREQRMPQEDTRGLRRYEDITFLRNMGNKLDNSPTKYIYESKVSHLISGTSRYSWSGFLINDRYFETDGEAETIEEYLVQGSEGIMPDPFAAKKRLMGDLPNDAREHFLIVLGTYLKHVNKESSNVFMAVDESIQSYKKNYWYQKICKASHRSNHHKGCPDSDTNRVRIREEHQEWMRRSVELLRKLSGILNQYRDEWKMFSDHGLNYFLSTDDASHLKKLRKSLVAVDQQVIGLERLRNKFKNIIDSYEDMSRNFNDRIALEDNESAFSQKRTARDVKLLTWITFVKQLSPKSYYGIRN